jgi:hypothetical protein
VCATKCAGFLIFLSLARGSIAGDEAGQHGRDQLGWLVDGLSSFATHSFGMGDQIAVDGRRQFDGQLDGLVIGDRAEFQLGHGSPTQP